MINERRLRFRRVQVYIEPRDAWIGVYVAPDAIYVLVLPFLVVRWDRGLAPAVLGVASWKDS